MGKIKVQIPVELDCHKAFLTSLLDRLESLPIIGGKVDYSSKKKCFALDLILSEKNTNSAIYKSGQTGLCVFCNI